MESDWRRYTFPFDTFNTDGSDIVGIFIGSAQDVGSFSIQIDDVQLQ
ncbi:MAG: hypothetical protein ABIL68_13280 [bacterium]